MTPFVGAFFFRPPYSHRNASIGSTRAARRAPPPPPRRHPGRHQPITISPPTSATPMRLQSYSFLRVYPTDGASPSRPIDFVFGLLSETACAPNRRPPSSAVSALVRWPRQTWRPLS